MDQSVKRAADLVRRARKTVAFTGAGVSTESGIPDFRSRGGLWSRYDPMEYGTIGAFRRDPEKVWRMLAELMFVVNAKPNAGHAAMAGMERRGYLQAVITQNIDGLHQKAGSRRVVEFHGSMASFSCLACGASYLLDEVMAGKIPPRCDCGEFLKPDVVFFDESIPPMAMAETRELISEADLLIVAGTSCQVVPASSIPYLVKQRRGGIIEVNIEPALGHLADVTLAGSFTAMMTGLAAALEI